MVLSFLIFSIFSFSQDTSNKELHVSGNILATGNFTNSGNISSSGSISTTSGITSNNSRMTINGSDLGISHVSFSGTTKSELVTYSNGNTTGIGSNNNFPFILYVNNSERLRVATNGNVGIRTTNPLGYLDFGQNANDSIINLFTNASTNETYKIGANNSLIKYGAVITVGPPSNINPFFLNTLALPPRS